MKLQKNVKGILSLVLVFVMLIGFAPAIAQAVEYPDEGPVQNLVLQKLEYQAGELTGEVENTGDIMELTDFGTVRVYDKSKYGDVEFSLYKVEDTTEKPFGEATPQAIADSVAKKETTYQYSPVTENSAIDADGIVRFDALENGHYVIVETKKPATVSQQAKPMFISLPITNAEGTGYKTGDIMLYPKNEVVDLELDLKKVTLGRSKTAVEEALTGATFTLYKGELGAGTVVTEGIISGTDGLVKLSNLAVDKYYLVETANNTEGNYLIGKYILNDTENKFNFEVTTEGEIVYPTGSLLSKENNVIINDEKPNLSKDITGIAEEVVPVYNVGDEIPYEIKAEAPNNIEDYTKFIIKDTPATGLVDDIATVEVSIVDADGTEVLALTENTHYTLTAAENGFVIETVLDNADIVENLGGNILKVTYKASLTEDAVVNANVENTARLDWSNGNTTEDGFIEDKEQVKTYEAKFIKKDAGLWGTTALGEGGLEGAKFRLGKEITTEGVVTWEVVEGFEEVVSGADGAFSVSGLNEGNYILVEIQAPEGYELPFGDAAVTEFTLNEESQFVTDAAYAMNITNTQKTPFPVTGLDAAGYAVVALAGLGIFTAIKKRNRKEA